MSRPSKDPEDLPAPKGWPFASPTDVAEFRELVEGQQGHCGLWQPDEECDLPAPVVRPPPSPAGPGVPIPSAVAELRTPDPLQRYREAIRDELEARGPAGHKQLTSFLAAVELRFSRSGDGK